MILYILEYCIDSTLEIAVPHIYKTYMLINDRFHRAAVREILIHSDQTVIIQSSIKLRDSWHNCGNPNFSQSNRRDWKSAMPPGWRSKLFSLWRCLVSWKIRLCFDYWSLRIFFFMQVTRHFVDHHPNRHLPQFHLGLSQQPRRYQ